ncbi:MAG TPA: Asp23/Gls24 family envelope stress response protein [Candidatus Acidoferrum sp.]|nr:Asp23/Gls24 family envelope stress response protein [Candidatus Acidoferrum sp.]
MSGPQLAVGRGVIEEMVRLAAIEVPGVCRVGRGGPAWRRFTAGRAVQVQTRDGIVSVSVAIVSRPGQPLVALTRAVRHAVAGAVERLLALELGTVTVVVDGVGV